MQATYAEEVLALFGGNGACDAGREEKSGEDDKLREEHGE